MLDQMTELCDLKELDQRHLVWAILCHLESLSLPTPLSDLTVYDYQNL